MSTKLQEKPEKTQILQKDLRIIKVCMNSSGHILPSIIRSRSMLQRNAWTEGLTVIT